MTVIQDMVYTSTNVAQATEGDGTEEYAASAQVWNTTELLEHIISYLPGKSIVVVSGVNRMASNCVANSSIAQSKLFMRPSGREEDRWVYCEFYLPRSLQSQGERQIVAQSFEPSKGALHKIRTRKSDAAGRSVSAVALCPLLELEDTQETSALGRLKRRGWQVEERVNLIGLPAEDTKYANMILTDPPVSGLEIELTYKHSLWPLLMIRAKRCVCSKHEGNLLTIGAVLSSACSQPDNTYLHNPPMPSNNYDRSHECLPESTVNDVILQTVQKHGGSFALDLTNTQLLFPYPHIVVPDAEERKEMDANRVQ